MSFLVTAARAARVAIALSGDDKNAKNYYAGTLYITDYRDLIRELRKIDRAYVVQLKKNIKRIAVPVQKGIAGTIPKRPPTSGIHVRDPKRTVSGFKPIVVPGRLSWGANFQNAGVKANHVKVEATSQKTWRKVAKYGQISIVRLAVDNAATVMADMAGRSRKWINKRPMTRPYLYSRNGEIVQRQHRINGQGIGMIKALDRGSNVQQGKASRWVWPTAEKYSAKSRMEIDALLTEANRYLNERLKTR